MKLHKRDSDLNQQVAKSVRPQLPRDGSRDGINYHENGMVPPGFISTWCFDENNRSTKLSPTTKPGRKVY